jgi:hypothetical protein
MSLMWRACWLACFAFVASVGCGTATTGSTSEDGGDSAGGDPGVSTCVPTSCGAKGKNCGTISDGCESTLTCGSCTVSGESCGGGGVANVCATGSCLPTTCLAQGKNCGLMSDGCGTMLPCGSCTSPATCGGGGVENVCGSMSTLPNFSFFVTSLKAMRELSGSQNGFGGDLRFGETGAGAGLRGADKLCRTIAETSMPGSSVKEWRAFLSVTSDENGVQVNAIDRIGSGPWYDRVGRPFASTKADLLYDRPQNGSATIKNDLPNEYGVPNHNPDGTGNVDNHDTLTGSNSSGRLYSSTATCKDWTVANGSSANGRPRVGHTWVAGGGGGGGGGPGGNAMANWMSALNENGCAADIYLFDNPPTGIGGTGVGSAGGYGGIYCFALTP